MYCSFSSVRKGSFSKGPSAKWTPSGKNSSGRNGKTPASLPEEEWYQWLEEALDRYENNAVREVRTAFPRCKEYQIRRLCLFFAGLSYPAIHTLTKDSVVSLKEAKSRFRKRFLALGTESGNFLASLLDGPSDILH